jgi:hypothetical protein
VSLACVLQQNISLPQLLLGHQGSVVPRWEVNFSTELSHRGVTQITRQSLSTSEAEFQVDVALAPRILELSGEVAFRAAYDEFAPYGGCLADRSGAREWISPVSGRQASFHGPPRRTRDPDPDIITSITSEIDAFGEVER